MCIVEFDAATEIFADFAFEDTQRYKQMLQRFVMIVWLITSTFI